MKVSKTLPKPGHWQDLETLCKKLWGEIWNCPEIKKVGRPGQMQKGVDLVGVPKGETEYYGIQCKGKNEYYGHQFTEAEISKEIEEARNFKPSLKKLYFATTANKDAAIEEFVRIKDLENRTSGLFEVHIFSWEDIVDLIFENRLTYDWYVHSINYKVDRGFEVTFLEGTKEMAIYPKFIQTNTNYQKRRELRSALSAVNESTQAIIGRMDWAKLANHFSGRSEFLTAHNLAIEEVNHSLCKIAFKLNNTGSEAIEEFKLKLDFIGDILGFADTNVKQRGLHVPLPYIRPDMKLSLETREATIVPHRKVLVGGDSYTPYAFFLKPSPSESTITINWRLLSKNFQTEGELLIKVIPDVIVITDFVTVDDPEEERLVEGPIEDCIKKGGDR